MILVQQCVLLFSFLLVPLFSSLCCILAKHRISKLSLVKRNQTAQIRSMVSRRITSVENWTRSSIDVGKGKREPPPLMR